MSAVGLRQLKTDIARLWRFAKDLETRLLEEHASEHEAGGNDPIDGGALETTYDPTNYTETDDDIEGHLEGIDDKLGTQSSAIMDNEGLLLVVNERLVTILLYLRLITGVDLEPDEQGGILGFLDEVIAQLDIIHPLE